MQYIIHINNNIGYGEREAHAIWPMVMPEKAAPDTGTISLRTTGAVPADARQ